MAYRLPTQLESLIPPPAEQAQQRRPWQGILTLTFMNAAPGTFQDVYVTAAETDGESRIDLWPRCFYVYLGARRTPHNDIQAWVKRYAPPICALMADKLPDPAANAMNQANFANLSRMFLDNQILALAPWGLDNLPGAGMIIYPTSGGHINFQGATEDQTSSTMGASGRVRPVCEYCKKDFGRVQELNRHVKDKHRPRRRCPFCDFIWTRPSNIKAHPMAEHAERFTAEMLEVFKAFRGHRIIAFVDAYDHGPCVTLEATLQSLVQVPLNLSPSQL